MIKTAEEVPVWVSNPEQAAVLLDPERRRVLAPFMAGETTITAAARQLRVKPNTLLRRVSRLLDLGLLRVTRDQLRAGRPVRWYASSAQRFYVPFQVTSAATLEQLLYQATEEPNRTVARGLARTLAGHVPQLGYLVSRLPSGRVQHALTLDGESELTPTDPRLPPLYREGRSLQLDEVGARRLQQELAELFGRYPEVSGGTHFLYLAFTPLPAR